MGLNFFSSSIKDVFLIIGEKEIKFFLKLFFLDGFFFKDIKFFLFTGDSGCTGNGPTDNEFLFYEIIGYLVFHRCDGGGVEKIICPGFLRNFNFGECFLRFSGSMIHFTF